MCGYYFASIIQIRQYYNILLKNIKTIKKPIASVKGLK